MDDASGNQTRDRVSFFEVLWVFAVVAAAVVVFRVMYAWTGHTLVALLAAVVALVPAHYLLLLCLYLLIVVLGGCVKAVKAVGVKIRLRGVSEIPRRDLPGSGGRPGPRSPPRPDR